MIRIAIADDHRIFLEGLSSLISKKKNIECVGIAGNAKELIAIVESKKIDIVVLDYSMPDYTGVELSLMLKEKYPLIKTIILSSFKNHKTIKEALEAKVSGYIIKEKGLEELEHALERVYMGKEYYSESVYEVVIDILRNKDKEEVNNYRELLTERELDVLDGIVTHSLSTPNIAKKLFISEATVSTHRKNIHSKLGVTNVNQLIQFTQKHNILGDEEIP